MILTEAQSKIAKDTHRFRVIRAGRRGGKTVLAVLEMAGKSFAKSGRNIVYIATTYQQARDIAWAQLKKILEPIAMQVNESRLEIKVRTQDGGYSLISLRGWENIDTLRGTSIHFAVLDEVASMKNFWENWQEVIRPTLTDTGGEAMFISTPKGFNHFYELYNLEAKDKDYKSFHFTSYDNPNIPDLQAELAKAKEELTPDRFEQEYMASFTKTEGLVYKEFDRDVHTYSDDNIVANIVETMAGIDFGFTNPTAIIPIKRDYQGHFWIYDEFYKTGKTDQEIADVVSAMKLDKVYPDPESPSAIKELRNKGVNVREVVKNKDSIKNGIDKVKELLKAKKLHIHKSCLNTIWELETYSYPDKKEFHNEPEIPLDENNHSMDALRYAIYMQPNEHRKAVTYIPNNLVRQPQSNIEKRTYTHVPSFKR